ncbi:MAG TPA: S8 family serine peptidase [Rubrobacteraceae bacterium]|nr:S8 family serine peptidase [Rubrobacteraceae bacterium]
MTILSGTQRVAGGTTLALGVAVMLAFSVLVTTLPDAAAREARPAGATAGGDHPTFKARPDREAIPGQIIVKFKKDVRPAAQADARRDEGLEKVENLDLIDAEVNEVSGQPVEQAIRDLENRPDVEYAEKDYRLYPTAYADEPRFSELWGLHNTGQVINGSTGVSNVDINGLEAAAVTQGDPNLVVAVIDDGVDFSHPDLAGRQWNSPGEIPGNGVDDDANGKVDDVNGWDVCHQDATVHDPGDDSHGTHVAGTIAASVNNQGITGVAPNVKIMALKFLSNAGTGPGCNSTSGAIEAIQYAKSEGAKISNNSWGGGDFSQALKDAIEASGSLFVAAAGNGGADGVGDNNDTVPMYPASYNSSNILSVAAVNNRGGLGGFSNYGATSVDISAPGVDILSSVPGSPGTPAAALSSVGTSGKAITAGFGDEEIGTAAGRASFMTKVFQAIGRGSQQVILVDDDRSHDSNADVGPTIAAAIQTATGIAPQTIPVGDGDGPSLAQLSGKTVVWATGETFYSGFDADFNIIPALTPADLTTLTNFLNGGGKLVITGRDALYQNETSVFVTGTLALSVNPDIFTNTFTGAQGTAFEGESYTFDGALADPFGISHDGISPAGASARTQGGYDAVPASWESWNGTSMATPHVTGVAALAASVNPALTGNPVALKNLIMNTGKPVSLTAGKTVTGDMADARAAVAAATPDTIKPTISGMSPRLGSIIRDTTPTIKAIVKDNRPLGKANIKLYVNGVLISSTKYSYAASTGSLVYNSPRLAKGKKTVKIVATDAAGNVGAKSWYFTIR